MENIVINRCDEDLPPRLYRLLPPRVVEALTGISGIEEIRLSATRQAWVRTGGRNLPLGVRLEREEFNSMIDTMCGGSLYAHSENICHGFIPLGGGLRAGVCGRAVLDGGKVCGIYDMDTVCIRVPHHISVDVSALTAILEENHFTQGVLIYAPPGGGKTTFLRESARCLASGASPHRVALVDTREELSFSLESSNLCLDVLCGYPKGYGIEIAVRTLGAEVIICDEIGGAEEAASILAIQSGGVPLIASAHAAGIRDLLARDGISRLHRAGVFGAYLGLSRYAEPTVTRSEDADAFL